MRPPEKTLDTGKHSLRLLSVTRQVASTRRWVKSLMVYAIWFIVCVALGVMGGLYSGLWGGLGMLILGIPLYFAGPSKFRSIVPERPAIIGAILLFAASATILPIGLSLGFLTP